MAITINVSPPYIPNGAGYTHTETQYIISSDRELSNVVIDHTSINAPELVLYSNPYTLDDGEVLYYKVILKFSNGNTIESDIDSIMYDKVTDVQISTVYTPKISINSSSLDVGNNNVTVSLSAIKLVYGNGSHLSTDWYVRTTSGITIWKREFDKDNLDSIIIPKNIFTGHNVYVIEARQRTETDESFVGRLIVSTDIQESNIVLESKPELEINSENILKVFVNEMIDTKLTWSLRDKDGEYIFNGMNAYIEDYLTPFNIIINGYKLEPSKDYILKIEAFTFRDSKVEREFNITTKPHDTVLDRYIIRPEFYELIKKDHIYGIIIPDKTCMTKEYINGLVPIKSSSSLIFYDLSKSMFDRNTVVDIANNVDSYFYQIDLRANELYIMNITRELITAPDEFKESLEYKKFVLVSGMLDVVLDSEYIIEDSNDVETYSGHGSLSVAGYTYIAKLNESNYRYYTINNTGGLDLGNTINSLNQYYDSILTQPYGVLNTLKRITNDDYIVEKNGIFAKINTNDDSVISQQYPEYDIYGRSILYEALNNKVINFRELDTGKLTILVIDCDTLDIVKTIDTDLDFVDSTFIETLDHKIKILVRKVDGHDIYEYV